VVDNDGIIKGVVKGLCVIDAFLTSLAFTIGFFNVNGIVEDIVHCSGVIEDIVKG